MDAWTWQQPFDADDDFETEVEVNFDNPTAFDNPASFSPLGFDNPTAFDSPLGFNPAGFDTPQGFDFDTPASFNPLGFDNPAGFDEETPQTADGFEFDAASGLFLPHQYDTIVSGPQAIAMMHSLNPFVVGALPADDADAFFKRLVRGVTRFAGRAFRGIKQFAGRAIRVVGKGLGRFARIAGPLLKRALPLIQKFARFIPGWGTLISAGLGAAQGLLSGKGLRGALAGALGGVIPGAGGKLVQAVLKGDGADDDASLDALADLADAGYADGAVALATGTGLAARLAARRGLSGVVPRGVRPTEMWMLQLSTALRGSPGRRLRILRSIGRLAAEMLRRRGRAAMVRGALLTAVRSAAGVILARLQRQPGAGTSSRAAAAARTAARQTVLANVPVGALFARYPGIATAN